MIQETKTATNGGSYTQLTATTGCYLTQAADTEITKRAFATIVCLAVSQTADDWTEIGADTYAAYQEELAAAIEAQEKAEQEAQAEEQETETETETDTAEEGSAE